MVEDFDGTVVEKLFLFTLQHSDFVYKIICQKVENWSRNSDLLKEKWGSPLASTVHVRE